MSAASSKAKGLVEVIRAATQNTKKKGRDTCQQPHLLQLPAAGSSSCKLSPLSRVPTVVAMDMTEYSEVRVQLVLMSRSLN
jgi:hypothetical protein